jgi:hypothetical protein
MLEGIRRARQLGATTIDVETGEMDAANALYDSIGFAERYRGTYWRKMMAPVRTVHPGDPGGQPAAR